MCSLATAVSASAWRTFALTPCSNGCQRRRCRSATANRPGRHGDLCLFLRRRQLLLRLLLLGPQRSGLDPWTHLPPLLRRCLLRTNFVGTSLAGDGLRSIAAGFVARPRWCPSSAIKRAGALAEGLANDVGDPSASDADSPPTVPPTPHSRLTSTAPPSKVAALPKARCAAPRQAALHAAPVRRGSSSQGALWAPPAPSTPPPTTATRLPTCPTSVAPVLDRLGQGRRRARRRLRATRSARFPALALDLLALGVLILVVVSLRSKTTTMLTSATAPGTTLAICQACRMTRNCRPTPKWADSARALPKSLQDSPERKRC